jgi:hypothetical protein
VLENPDHISKHVLSKGLDAGTAYEILSIDIADVDVGENIGAKLQIDQANADKQIAQAKAEERRAAIQTGAERSTPPVPFSAEKTPLAPEKTPVMERVVLRPTPTTPPPHMRYPTGDCS